MRTTVPAKIKGKFGRRIYLVLNTLFHYDRKFNADLLMVFLFVVNVNVLVSNRYIAFELVKPIKEITFTQ